MLVKIASDSSKAQQLVILDVLGRRRAAEGVVVIRRALQSEDGDLRTAAIAALGRVARDEDIISLVNELTSGRAGVETTVLMDALKTACQRVSDREKVASVVAQQLRTASPAVRGNLVELLGILGGKTALEAVAEAARSADLDLQDAATAALGNWLSPDVAPVIWSLIETNAAPRYRVRLIRGYIRVARQFNVPETERLEMCRKALSVAERADERRLVLDVLRRNPSPQSLALAAELIPGPDVQVAACETVVTIAEKLNKNVPGLREALQKVIENCRNAQIRARAEALLKQSQ